MKLTTVAIIDDDPVYHLNIKMLLSELDSTSKFLIFNNGKEAYEFLIKSASDNQLLPDCMLLDLEMPVMDGFEFLEKFQQIKGSLKKNIAVFIVTSSSEVKDNHLMIKYPFVRGYLTKPISGTEIKKIRNAAD